MKTTIRNIAFEQLPDIEGMDIFRRLEQDVENILVEDGPLLEIYERSHAALMFFCDVGKSNSTLKNSALLRAGLNEFYSMEEAAKRDFDRAGFDIEPPKISNSSNPLVHLMYLLRHVNVHAKVSSTKTHQTSVISRLGGEEHEIEWHAIVLDQPTFGELGKCREAKKYYIKEDLEQAAKWLDEVQYIFGIGEVLRRGLSSYCRELLAAARLFA